MINNDNFYDKANTFLKTNWWLLWIAIVVQTVIVITIAFGVDSKVDKVLAKVEKSNLGVILMSKDGRAAKTGKTFLNIKQEGFKNHLLTIIEKYIILDANRVIGNAENSTSILDANDLYVKNKTIKEFGEKFCDLSSNKKVVKQFEHHLKTLLGLLNSDELIEDIEVIESRTTIEKYVPKSEKEFEMVVTFTVKTQYYLKEQRQWKNGRGAIKVIFHGEIDDDLSGFANPFGIKPTYFSVTYPRKRKKSFNGN